MTVQPTGGAPSSTGRTERAGESRSGGGPDAAAAFGLALAEAKGAAQRRTTQPVQTRESRDTRDTSDPRDGRDVWSLDPVAKTYEKLAFELDYVPGWQRLAP